MGYGKNSGDLKIGTTATDAAAGNKGVTNGDNHNHTGGAGATIPIAGGGTGATTAGAARTNLGISAGIAEPSALYTAAGGVLHYDTTAAAYITGIYDACTGGSVDARWTQSVPAGQSLTATGSVYRFVETAGVPAANAEIAVDVELGIWEMQAYISIAGSPPGAWNLCFMQIQDRADSATFAGAYFAYQVGTGYVLVASDKGGETSGGATGAAARWIKFQYDMFSGVINAFYSANAAGSPPADDDWVYKCTRTVAGVNRPQSASLVVSCGDAGHTEASSIDVASITARRL